MNDKVMIARITSNMGDLMSASSTRPTDEAVIRTLIEDWAEAVRFKDYDTILSNLSSDMSMFDVPAPLQSKCLDEYKKTWDTFFDRYQEVCSFDISEMKIQAGSEVALVTVLMRCAGVEQGGSALELDLRLAIGLHKVAGQWLITHEHHSLPAD